MILVRSHMTVPMDIIYIGVGINLTVDCIIIGPATLDAGII